MTDEKSHCTTAQVYVLCSSGRAIGDSDVRGAETKDFHFKGIVKGPKFLLLDEATSALDSHSEKLRYAKFQS